MNKQINQFMQSIRKIARVESQTGKSVLDTNFYELLVGSQITHYALTYTILRKENVTATFATQKENEKRFAEKMVEYYKQSKNVIKKPAKQKELPFISFEDALSVVKAAGCKVIRIEKQIIEKEVQL